MIIGIAGRARSGKDTCAEYLVENHGFTNYKFAGPIKEACQEIFLWGCRHTDGELKEVVDPFWGISPREAMRFIGLELFRQALPNLSAGFKRETEDSIWVKRFKKWYEDKTKVRTYDVVISDVRFPNEAEIIQDMGGKVIRLKTPEIDNNGSTHGTESMVDFIIPDIIIDNRDYSESFLKKSIEEIYQELKTKL
jgi:hypothetical protein